MARAMGRLSVPAVKSTKTKGLYPDGGGLYLHVSASGAKSWVYRFMLGGKAREMGLGPSLDVSLKEARDKAAEARRLKLDGLDPIEVRRAKRAGEQLAAVQAMTFEQCAEAYIADHKAGWRSLKHAAQWSSTLQKYAYPIFGKKPIQNIDVKLVLDVLRPIWESRTETAGRVRGRVETILDWAAVQGFRNGENPARWRGHLDKLLPAKSKVQKVEHHTALSFDKMVPFMAELDVQAGLGARALEFLVLTAARTGEVIGARWDEIDIANRVWTVPGARMKAGKDHRVPLSGDALAMLDRVKPSIPAGGAPAPNASSEFVFPGAKADKPLSNMAMLKVLKRMGRGDLTAHGFRSSFRDWAAERTDFPREVVEMALSHAIESKVEAAYRRGDLFEKRRALMEAWAGFCTVSATDCG